MSVEGNPPPTAADVMSRDVKTLGSDVRIPEAARHLARWEVRGAPVVDDGGRCVGMLSVSDLARWILGRGARRVELPRTCSFQEKLRESGGREEVRCLLEEGVCPFQRLRELPDGKLAIMCGEPHCVPTDWQVVEVESVPGDRVRDVMTTTPVVAAADTPAPELARLMLEHRVGRLVVLDAAGCPVGVVTATDLLPLLARPEPTEPAPQ